MEDFCPCCSVKYSTDQVGYFDVCTEDDYESSQHNFKFVTTKGKEICWWCANNIPSGIVDVVHKQKEFYNISDTNKKYTIENYKEYFELAKRIKEVMAMKSASHSCPSCGGEMKDKYSEYVGGNIKKCSNCGWC